jgi:hypothetical protein
VSLYNLICQLEHFFFFICKISVKTFSSENKNSCNDFKELNSKLLGNNENREEERNSNSNKT